MKLQVRADLDIPGETGRQTRVFFLWLACLALAVTVASFRASTVTRRVRAEASDLHALAQGRKVRVAWGLFLGFALPLMLTMAINRRRRRSGAHARGIVIDITDDDELRIWGRGYGLRVELEGAQVRERMVHAYCGRLGSWQQRRLHVRGQADGRSVDVELATRAHADDAGEDLDEVAGEGTCIEVDRNAYNSIRRLVMTVRGNSELRERGSSQRAAAERDA